MKSAELLDLLDRNLDDAAAKGARAVDVSAFKQMVASLRKIVQASTVQAAVEEQKRMQMSFENWLETNKQRHEWQLEAFRSVIQSGQSALKSCVLINGGAAVALLAFVGHPTRRVSGCADFNLPTSSRDVKLEAAVGVADQFADADYQSRH